MICLWVHEHASVNGLGCGLKTLVRIRNGCNCTELVVLCVSQAFRGLFFIYCVSPSKNLSSANHVSRRVNTPPQINCARDLMRVFGLSQGYCRVGFPWLPASYTKYCSD